MYAPVDTDRTLYVFGCNSVDCTETPRSWRVLRDQSDAVASAVAAVEAKQSPGSTAPTNAWDAGSDSDSSDWGDHDDDDDDPFAVRSADQSGGELIDLEQLLLQRDDAMKLPATVTAATNKSSQQKKTMLSASGPGASSATKASSSVFPAMPIEVVDEPYEDYTSENDYSHENALLQEYIKQEEEEKSADVHDLRKVISSTKKTGGGGGAAASSSSSESYEKTPAQQRHFMRFQKRISRCPLQCLRYDYGGEPLWPVSKPQHMKIPKCVCGEDRVFELQLTPTINYFLKVDQFATSITSTPVAATTSSANDSKAGSPEQLKSAGGGMDWLSVMVYCCPKSCSRSREEFVFVLPAEKA